MVDVSQFLFYQNKKLTDNLHFVNQEKSVVKDNLEIKGGVVLSYCYFDLQFSNEKLC